MKILVDADACPVKEMIVEEAKKRNIEVIMVIDTSHVINDGYSTVITVDKARDSADIKLINITKENDIVVTQDFGVAAMALGRKAFAINQNGLIYNDGNINSLLMERHIGQKIRRSGGRTGSIKKRTSENDLNFKHSFIEILDKFNQA